MTRRRRVAALATLALLTLVASLAVLHERGRRAATRTGPADVDPPCLASHLGIPCST